MNKIQTWGSVIIMATTIAIPLFSLAAPTPLPGVQINDINSFITDVLCTIAAYLIDVLLIVSIIILLIVAYMYLLHGNEPEEIRKAHFWILYAAIGVIVALVAKGFPFIVSSIIGANLGTIARCL